MTGIIDQELSQHCHKARHITCGNHVMPRFRSGTPDTAEPLGGNKKNIHHI